VSGPHLPLAFSIQEQRFPCFGARPLLLRSDFYKNTHSGPFCLSCPEQKFVGVLICIRIHTPGPVAFLETEHKFECAPGLAFAARATGNRQQATGQRQKVISFYSSLNKNQQNDKAGQAKVHCISDENDKGGNRNENENIRMEGRMTRKHSNK
jgi:hypothetical protein